MAKNIVLAHGVLGFGALPLPIVQYFHGVASHLRTQNHDHVLEPTVPLIGDVEARARSLAQQIGDWPATGDPALRPDPAQPIHIIAHSMGGLDARFAISRLHLPRIATLVTVGTPHNGSPVADAIVEGTGPLAGQIDLRLNTLLDGMVGALPDLTTAKATKFNLLTPDLQTVRYIEVAGDAGGANANPEASRELLLFDIAAQIGGITREINDGVVTRSSALRPGRTHLTDWSVDHAGEVGWYTIFGNPNPLVPRADHLARYDAIVALL